MKLILLTLLPFFSLAQASTYEPGDSTWITSSDTSKVKVYKGDKLIIIAGLDYTITQEWIDSLKAHGKTFHYTNQGNVAYAPPVKYDTIGPVWKQVSDITSGYNPVMAMQLYEVRIYKNEWVETDRNILIGGTPSFMDVPKEQRLIPHHYAWLDLKKKPFKLTVWEDKAIAATERPEMSIDQANAAGMFNSCPVPNPTTKRKK